MKNSFLTAVPFLALCALTSQMALAGTQADLTIGGQIVSGACDMSLGNGGNFSYGDIFAKDLDKTGPTQLPFIDTTFNITCSGPRYVAIRHISTGANVASLVQGSSVKLVMKNGYDVSGFGASLIGLGFSSNGKKIGSYFVAFESGTFIADGKPAQTLWKNGGAAWANVVNSITDPYGGSVSTRRQFTFGNASIPTPITTGSGNVYTRASIAYGQGLTFDNTVNLNGNDTTLELVYF
jgi:hypothetical protein